MRRTHWAIGAMLLAATSACSSEPQGAAAVQTSTAASEASEGAAAAEARAPAASAWPQGRERAAAPAPEPTPVVGPPVPDLARYLGKNPFEAVDGTDFLHHPRVQDAVRAVVKDAAIRKWVLTAGANPWKPVWRHGAALVTAGCQQHGCEQRSWTIVMDPATGSARVCFERDGTSRWYDAEGVAVATGSCPFEEDDLVD
ncbi:hypothetical protein HT136_13120 [Novosphingobium profundi]|uniref:hypothetical protein n=1 Tax=Novosphingobium profundi TaxID=1774954 RepID=UPI001BDB3750|nr:hypothetical protein [Novosphingobium profundi]MBT0669306.1 hypothetical protein [Novosphingobium profundi]